MTPEAEELLRAGRESFKPSDADRARVFESLSAQIGGAGLVGLSTTAAKSAWLPLSATAVGLGLLGGGLYLAFLPEPLPAPSMPVVQATKPTEPVPVAPPVLEPKPEVPVVEPKLPAPRTTTGSASTVRVDHLAEEVAILSRAGADLHSGRAAAALKALDEHQRKFPGGALSQERSAARVQALCALGRMREAEAELKRLSKMSPRSPHEARARKACGIGSDSKN